MPLVDVRSGMAVRALALLLLGLALLAVGRFIQFHDTSGFGSNEWVFPFGILGVVSGVASFLLAWTDNRARRAVGFATAGLLALIVWQSATNDGFRFIWTTYEGELFLLEVGLGLVALTLVATSYPPKADGLGGSRSRWYVRAVAYIAATVAVMFLAFLLGHAHFEATECGGGGGECDLAGLAGLVWAGGAFVLCAVAAVVIEATYQWRREWTRHSS